MMLDFNAVRSKRITIDELCRDLDIDDLRRLTNEMLDAMQTMIAAAQDEDVVFVPDDPEAEDTFAVDPDEALLAWTLGHVIVHVTASAEEAAYLAAELARGVPLREGRSRFEIPWRSVTTIAQCRQRLEESRRMRLASLAMWPDPPHLDVLFTSPRGNRSYNAVVRFVFGLMHDQAHLDQIAKIVRQAEQARTGLTPPPPYSDATTREVIIVEFKQHYVVLMRKGPDWTADDTPELDELQKRHQAHLSAMHEAGMLVLAGPVELHADGDIRGISVFSHDVFRSLDDLKAVVERDPAIQAGRLRAEYLTWFTESSAVIGPRGEVCN